MTWHYRGQPCCFRGIRYQLAHMISQLHYSAFRTVHGLLFFKTLPLHNHRQMNRGISVGRMEMWLILAMNSFQLTAATPANPIQDLVLLERDRVLFQRCSTNAMRQTCIMTPWICKFWVCIRHPSHSSMVQFHQVLRCSLILAFSCVCSLIPFHHVTSLNPLRFPSLVIQTTPNLKIHSVHSPTLYQNPGSFCLLMLKM